MSIPPPSEKQARILWFSLTTLAIAVSIALLGLLLLGSGWVINKLSSVILPLAVAGILACLLDPVVDFLESRVHVPRRRAILLVFLLAITLVLALLAAVVPQLIYEAQELANNFPQDSTELKNSISNWLAKSNWTAKAREAWDTQWGAKAQEAMTSALPVISTWALTQLTRVASWAGFILGMALVPIYVFYFLLEKAGILEKWTDYLPLTESKIKSEAVFIIQSINECLVVFFRGQVLVSLCTGTMLTIGFLSLGLKYGLLLGLLAAMLGIVPYLGTMVCLATALIISLIQFQDWQHPLIVLCLFGLVQLIEGFVVSPKIIGDRVGLHPLTIIIAVMVGTTLLGGILGGMLAIPLTAALRTLMFRYVWKRPVTA